MKAIAGALLPFQRRYWNMKLCMSIMFACVLMAPCSAQVVQLPAVGSFQVSTTVSVPDQGTASLGGVGRSGTGAVRGWGPNSAIGGQLGASSASVSVTVIDLAAMDEALLNMPAESKNVPNYAKPSQGTKIVNTLVPHDYNRDKKVTQRHPYDWMVALGPQGTAQVDSAENKVLDGSNARYFLEKAAAAHSTRHIAAAKVYYQMALDRMSPAQRKRMEEIRASRSVKPAEKTKNGQTPAKTGEAATGDAPATPAADPAASPFDPPAGAAGANTDMTSSPF